MYDNYPPGAALDPNAPYNQVDPPECEFTITASVTLERECIITSDEVYNDDGDWTLCDDANVEATYNYDYASIPQCLDELVKYVDAEMQTDVTPQRKQFLQRLRDSATGWTTEYFEYSH